MSENPTPKPTQLQFENLNLPSRVLAVLLYRQVPLIHRCVNVRIAFKRRCWEANRKAKVGKMGRRVFLSSRSCKQEKLGLSIRGAHLCKRLGNRGFPIPARRLSQDTRLFFSPFNRHSSWKRTSLLVPLCILACPHIGIPRRWYGACSKAGRAPLSPVIWLLRAGG